MRDVVVGTHNSRAARTGGAAVPDATAQTVASADIADASWANRGFAQRAVRWLATRQGVRQFLDIGSYRPDRRNTHEALTGVVAGSTVVYTHCDRQVIEHGCRTLARTPGTALVPVNLHYPEEILRHPVTRRVFDLHQPVAVLMVAVTPLVADAEDPWRLVERYLEPLAAGSWLVLSDLTSDHQADRLTTAVGQLYGQRFPQVTFRTRAAVERYFHRLQIVPPYEGADPVVTHVGLWGAEDPELADSDGSRWFYAAVARKH
jgi:hypothetical protein